MKRKMKFVFFIALLSTLSLHAAEIEVVDNKLLNEITVTATRSNLPLKQIPQKVEIITQKQIAAIPSQNLGEILKRSTNLDILEYPGAMVTIGMRGFAPSAHNRSYTVLLVDGKPAGTNNLATLPSDMIERIEVIKGPYSVLYGSDAMGGVINVVTKKPTQEIEGKVEMGMGSFGQNYLNGYATGGISSKLFVSGNFSVKNQTQDYRIGQNNLLSLTETEKNILDKKSYGDAMTNTKYNINQFGGKLTYLFNDHWSAMFGTNAMTSNDIETPGNYWHSYGLSKKDIYRFANSLDLQGNHSNNDLTLSLYHSNQRESNYSTNTDAAFITSKEVIKQYGVKASNTHTWGALRWLAGLDFDAFEVASDRFSDKITEINPYRPDNNRYALSALSQVTYDTDRLHLNAGVRYNFIRFRLEGNELLGNEASTSTYNNINPSVGAKFYITPEWSIRASMGNAFYVPDAYKRAGVYKIGSKDYVGNINLKAENVTSFEAAINYSKGELFNLDLTYFHNLYNNKIVNDNSRKDTVSYKNALDGTMNGLELLFSSNIASLWTKSYRLELFGGLTYNLRSTFNDEVGGEILQRDLLYVRKVTGNFGIAFESPKGFDIRLTSRYIGHRLENDWMSTIRTTITESDYYTGGGYTAKNKILRHPSALVFDLSAHYHLNRHFGFGITGSNLLDENYSEKDGYNMPGRVLMGHISYKF